jgi:hypothetical protein
VLAGNGRALLAALALHLRRRLNGVAMSRVQALDATGCHLKADLAPSIRRRAATGKQDRRDRHQKAP